MPTEDTSKLTELRQQRKKVFTEQEQMLQTTEADGRGLNDEENKRYEDLTAQEGDLRIRIERLQDIEERRKFLAAHPDDARPNTVRDIKTDDKADEYRSFGEFARTVMSATGGDRNALQVLEKRAATTYGQELVGQDGGFLVPPQFSDKILSLAMGDQSLYGRADQIQTAGFSMEFPKDEVAPWDTSTGLIVSTVAEGATMTQRKPVLKKFRVECHKYGLLVGATDELLEDATALTGYLTNKAGGNIRFKLGLDMIQGNGAGELMGIVNASCTIAIVRGTATTIKFADVLGMWERRLEALNEDAWVWIVSPDAEIQLMQMLFSGSLTDIPVYMPAGGISGKPYGTLFGWPVLRSHACSALGTKGDFCLANMKEYLALTKSSGLRTETSIHLWFDQDITAFRFIIRAGGEPWLSAAVSPRAGSNTLSHFIVLDAAA